MVATTTGVRVLVPVSEWYTVPGTNFTGTGKEAQAVIQWGVEDTLTYDFPNEPRDFDLQFEFRDTYGSSAYSVELMIEYAQRGLTLAVGYPTSQITVQAGLAASVYNVAQISTSTTSSKLSDKETYPYFSRLTPTASDFTIGMVGTILHMMETQGEGWSKVALLSTSDEFGVSQSYSFLQQIKDTAIQLGTWQTFLPGGPDVSVEIDEVVASDARVIVIFAVSGYGSVLREAKRRGILDDLHVYIGGTSIAGLESTYRPSGILDTEIVENMRGNLGILPKVNREGLLYERLQQRWTTADMSYLPYWGPNTAPANLALLNYDLGVLLAHTMVEAQRQGILNEARQPSAEQWTRIIRSVSFDGASGPMTMDSKGDRPMPLFIANWLPEPLEWHHVGEFTQEAGVVLYPDEEIIWQDNTTNWPDLLRGPGYHYWSCDAGKKYYDETGHTVTLHTPGSGGFDDIDSNYICDHFIDCPNLSDESGDCDANYTALFIAFGILTGILILVTCCLIPFVIVFGFIFPRRRIKASSPTFLILIILSCLLGFISEYSWYGRPHPVGCGFRPWLLGLAVVSLVSALSAKTWRLWRIFKKAYKKERISDMMLLALYAIMVIPAIIILVVWTIVSTPTARLEERDDREHYVCTTGGFTGKPGAHILLYPGGI